MQVHSITQSWRTYAESKKGRAILKYGRMILIAAVITFLFYQLNKIGWVDILKSLPTNPLFYLLFLMRYFALPLSEQLIYRLSLKFPFREGFKVFVTKKILNSDLVAYSGEAYIYSWAKRSLKLDNKRIFHLIKDNNLISAFMSTITAIVLLSILVFYGQVNFLDFLTISEGGLAAIGGGILVLLFLLVYFRKRILAFDTKTTLKVMGIHQMRIFVVYTLDVLQCVVALPFVPLNIWFTFLAIQIIYTRIPFLPGQDLVLLGIYAKVSEMYDVPQAEIMAVYITIAALARIMNLVLYSSFSIKSAVKDKAQE